MAKRPDPTARIVDSTLKLAADHRWRDISLEDIAAKAKIPMAGLYDHFRCKQAILSAFNTQIDRQMLTDDEGQSTDETVRDRLFEVLMRRFDAMQPHREAIGSILRDTVIVDPIASLIGLADLKRSMAWALEAAGVSSAGPVGHLRAKVLGAIYLSVVRAWLVDDSDDLSKTMAALDRGLQRAEQLNGLCRLRRPRAERAAAQES